MCNDTEVEKVVRMNERGLIKLQREMSKLRQLSKDHNEDFDSKDFDYGKDFDDWSLQFEDAMMGMISMMRMAAMMRDFESLLGKSTQQTSMSSSTCCDCNKIIASLTSLEKSLFHIFTKISRITLVSSQKNNTFWLIHRISVFHLSLDFLCCVSRV